MRMGNVEVFIRRGINTMDYEMTFFEIKGERDYYVAKPVKLVMEKHEVDIAVEPTMVIPYYWQKSFFESITKSMHDIGFQCDSEYKVHGLYEAQSKHLADMRTLLKLK